MHSFSFVPPIDDEEMEALMAHAQELGLAQPNLIMLDFEKSIASGHPVAADTPPLGLAHLTNSYRAGKVVHSRVAQGDDLKIAVEEELDKFLSPDDQSTYCKFLHHAIFTDLCAFELPVFAATSAVLDTVLWIARKFIDLAYAREHERADKWREELR